MRIISALLFLLLFFYSCIKDDQLPSNTAPEANFTISPQTADFETVITLDASSCFDQEDPLEELVVRWDFEGDSYYDTEWSTEKVIEHTFFPSGEYKVILEVMDTKGLSTTTYKLIQINIPDYFTMLKDYFLSADLDLNHIIKSKDDVMFLASPPETAADIPSFVEKYDILDIRSASHYNSGHIEGAIRVSMDGILLEAENTTKQILVVDYNGQVAASLVALLRLSGYTDAQALKWGMCQWHEDFAEPWDDNLSDYALGHTNWSYHQAPNTTKYTKPIFMASGTVPYYIFQQRILAVMEVGLFGIKHKDVLDAPHNFFINSYMPESDYLAFGHIQGAYCLNQLLLSDESILNLNPDEKIVIYDYTGMTAALVATYLSIFGYDATYIRYGMNSLYHSNPAWQYNNWGVDSTPRNLPYETN